MPEISVLVEAGKATAAAPLGPALGPMGVDIGAIVAQINTKTKDYAGMKVPVTVVIDSGTKAFEIKVGSPPTSALIKKELGLKKAAGNPKTENVGNLSLEQAKKLANMKMDNLTSFKLKSAVREIVGACNTMGVRIEGMHAKAFQEALASGKYDSQLTDGAQAQSAPAVKPAPAAEPQAEEKPAEAPAEGAAPAAESKPVEEKPAE
ncbi:50S ribosomal protein L11 [Candidatus Micrarchaeota archaeon]|nr:50S ribosomal protein L11 [Candidatus Micrarchaeota archaeon]MBU1939955.1 50S ribosomal protein L11 [Candidatus Micrarchaeota archaeon]